MQEGLFDAFHTQERGSAPDVWPQNPGVLLLHGFTSAPEAVSGFTPTLDKLGIPWEMPILRGHNQTPDALIGVKASDWYDDALDGLKKLATRAQNIFVIGLSMGGLVALNLCANQNIHGIKIAGCITWAAALGFCNPFAGLVRPLSLFFKTWKGQDSFRDPECRKNNKNYQTFPTKSFVELYDYAAQTWKNIDKIDIPICIIHSKRDQVVPYKMSCKLFESIPSKYAVFHSLDVSGHELGQDCQAELVFKLTADFIVRS